MWFIFSIKHINSYQPFDIKTTFCEDWVTHKLSATALLGDYWFDQKLKVRLSRF